MDHTETENRCPSLTRIVATLGPASGDPVAIGHLVDEGATVFRLNFSHLTTDAAGSLVRAVRDVAESRGVPVALLGDLQGPKIRVGAVDEAGIELHRGMTVNVQRTTIHTQVEGDTVWLSTTHDGLVDDVQEGHRLLINDGAIRLLAVDTGPDFITAIVTQGGLLTSAKGMNLPDTDVSVDSMTDRDWDWVRWSVEHGLDFLALSFVRNAAEVVALKDGIAKAARDLNVPGGDIPVIAKIETPQAVRAIDAINDVADGIMVARGDLGVELDPADVPVVQKRLIESARRYGRPCIVATQMLQSMIESPVPTRAEVSDVSHAILDGAHAVMLSGETAVGRYPDLAVAMMRRSAVSTERWWSSQPRAAWVARKLVERRSLQSAVAHAVWEMASDLAACCIVVWSQKGDTARLLSQHDFAIPIAAFSTDVVAARRMQLLRAVRPYALSNPGGLDEFVAHADQRMVDDGLATPGTMAILLVGEPLGVHGNSHRILVHEIGRPLADERMGMDPS